MTDKKTTGVQPKDTPRTVTVQGVELTVDPSIFDDLEITEALYSLQHADTDTGDGALAIIPLLRRLCGEKYETVKHALRDPDTGRIPLTVVGDFITQLMGKLVPNS